MDTRKLHVILALVLGLAITTGVVTAFAWQDLAFQTLRPEGSTIRYVATAGTDEGNDCSDSGSPCQTVQRAIDEADEEDEIHVAAGVYTEVGVRPRADITNTGTVSQVAYVSKTVTIRGGYSPTDWGIWDPAAHPTTLYADQKGRALYITGDISPTIEGLHITGGDAAGLGGDRWGNDVGGGVYVISATATLTNNLVTDNTAFRGGGVGLYRSAAQVEGSVITGNTAGSGGAGLYAGYGGATLRDNTIVTNDAGWSGQGGGVYLDYGDSVFLAGNVITGNTAYDGGGVYSKSSAMLADNTVSGNTAYGWGGGLLLNGTSTLESNVIADNTAEWAGGGVCIIQAYVVADGDTVRGNSSREGGGVYLFYYGNLRLVNSLVTDNDGSVAGSGLYFYGSSGDLLHTTIARNTGGDGSGIRLDTHYIGHDSDVEMFNTILVSQTVGVQVQSDNTATLDGTLWGAGEWANGADWGGAGTMVTGTVNLWEDPLFVDPDAGDYHIGPTSAAIDHGIEVGVSSDIDREARPIGPAPDIGADEFYYCYALSGVTLSGPTEGYTNTLYAFSGMAEPVGATKPLTYTWAPSPSSGQGTDTAGYMWGVPDDYTVTLTVENCGGMESDTHSITISALEEDGHLIFLPAVLRRQ